jgi:ankyrin repeat protein
MKTILFLGLMGAFAVASPTPAAFKLPNFDEPEIAFGTAGVTDLMRASAEGRLDKVRELVQAGGDVNARTADLAPSGARIGGLTPLLLAVGAGHWEVARVLVEAGAKVDVRSANGSTALGAVLANEERRPDAAFLKYLLAHRADPDAATGHGETPLMLAVMHSSLENVTALLDAGARVDLVRRPDGWTALMIAAWSGRTDVAALLIERGARVNEANHRDSMPAYAGFTPLFLAVARGRVETARMLLDKGANVNAADGAGRTPLIEAAAQGDEEMVRLLLANGADPRARVKMDSDGAGIFSRVKSGQTVLAVADANGHGQLGALLPR